MKRIVCWGTLILLAGSLAATAQIIKVPESWDRLAASADEVVTINLDRRMLRFASNYMDLKSADEAKAQQIISRLNGIVVRHLDFKQPGAYTEAEVEPVRRQLQGGEWSRSAEWSRGDNKSAREKVEVYLRLVQDKVLGLTVLAQEPRQLTLVLIDGPIDPADLEDLGGHFGIPKGIQGRPQKGVAPAKPATTAAPR